MTRLLHLPVALATDATHRCSACRISGPLVDDLVALATAASPGCSGAAPVADPTRGTFTNPLLESGPDRFTITSTDDR